MSREEGESKEIVVVGAGYAGMVAALRCSRLAARQDNQVNVTLVNPTDRFVERVRLHQSATGQRLRAISVSRLLRDRPARLEQGWVVAVDPAAGKVIVRSAAGESSLGYDLLVYTVGSAVDLDAVPGVRELAHSLADLSSAQRFLAALTSANERKRVVVCGGGATGIEAALEVAGAFPHLRVSLVTRGEPGGWLSSKARLHIADSLTRAGVEVVGQSDVRVVGQGRLELGGGERIPFDLCLWAGPFKVSQLATNSGIACDNAGRIVVDSHLRSVSHPTIIAAGDAALARCPDGAPTRMACATAIPMGLQAAEVAMAELAGGDSLPIFHNRYVKQCLSLGRRDGILQDLDQHDSPSGHVVVGRRAAWGKELIVRSTIWMLQMARRYPGAHFPGLGSQRRVVDPDVTGLPNPDASPPVPEQITQLTTAMPQAQSEKDDMAS